MHNPLFFVYRKSITGKSSPHRMHRIDGIYRCAGAFADAGPGYMNCSGCPPTFAIVVAASRELVPVVVASLHCGRAAAPAVSLLLSDGEWIRRTW